MVPPFAIEMALTPQEHCLLLHSQAIIFLHQEKKKKMGNQICQEYKFLFSLTSEIISQFYHETSHL